MTERAQLLAAVQARTDADHRVAVHALLELARSARLDSPAAAYIVLAETDQDDSGALWVQAVYDIDHEPIADDVSDGDTISYHLHQGNETTWLPFVTVLNESDESHVGEFLLDIGRVLSLEDPCGECKDGYLLDQTYGFADVHDGWTEVQRCDTCQTFDGDAEAARIAAQAVGNVRWGYFPAEGDLPGDFAIRWTS